jgi:peptide-methionine (S)-S-oxide reductase
MAMEMEYLVRNNGVIDNLTMNYLVNIHWKYVDLRHSQTFSMLHAEETYLVRLKGNSRVATVLAGSVSSALSWFPLLFSNGEYFLFSGGCIMKQERAVLAGGCFWGMQGLIRQLPGVEATRVGYTGGDVPNATYRNHGTHAEGIEILFDPDRITYRRILEFFFQIHDPTTINQQGNDRGSSYRSAIYYVDEAQKQVALATIADVNASGLWPGKVVTELEPAGDFWEAEPEHQDYLERFPNGYTCHYLRPNWALPKRGE